MNTYACSSEFAGFKGEVINGIGTACHEFSHCLGIPDFYDVNYGGGIGMGAWDIMNSGSYNGPKRIGEVPCGYSAYERWFCGWLDFTELSGMQRIKKLESLEVEPKAFKIVNDAYPDEYFILENRQPGKWFSYFYEFENPHGMLITHVDYLPTAWETNRVNTIKTHQRYSYVAADNDFGKTYSSSGVEYIDYTKENIMGDLFPGLAGVREFTDSSHPESGGALFNEAPDGSFRLGKPVTNIKESEDGVISFDFMGGIYVETPRLNEAMEQTPGSFKISWESDSCYDTFTVEAREIKNPLSSFINPAEKVIVEGIRDKFYHFNNLKATKYKFRVRAVFDEACSEWSDFKEVTLPSGIESIEADPDTLTPKAIFNASGLKVEKISSPGVYILDYGCGFTRKVML